MEWKSKVYQIADVKEWSNANLLELKPDVQRTAVWSKAAQIALIDTIILNIPMPKIYVEAIAQKDKTYHIVIDGQQRLKAILDFLENKFQLNTPHISLPNLNGFTFSELPENIKNKILSYNLDFNEVFKASKKELQDLYTRINKYILPLNKQELRNADYPGEFLNLAEELADLDFFLNNSFFTTGQKRRRLDIEYIEELLALLLEGEQNKTDNIDEICERYMSFPQGLGAIRTEFQNIINDIDFIFNDAFKLNSTRFKQKANFYTLFGCISDFKNQNKILSAASIKAVQKQLKKLNTQATPHSKTENYRNYAINCATDANSLAARLKRKDFLKPFIAPLYIL
jgi:hypothetical protein